jgi:hypothetical protein
VKILGIRIRRVHKSSERAIKKFLTTEQKLLKHNEVIDAAVTEIDDKIAELNELKSAAVTRKQENAGIAARIGQIVRGGGVE